METDEAVAQIGPMMNTLVKVLNRLDDLETAVGILIDGISE